MFLLRRAPRRCGSERARGRGRERGRERESARRARGELHPQGSESSLSVVRAPFDGKGRPVPRVTFDFQHRCRVEASQPHSPRRSRTTSQRSWLVASRCSSRVSPTHRLASPRLASTRPAEKPTSRDTVERATKDSPRADFRNIEARVRCEQNIWWSPNGQGRLDEITNTWRDVKRALSLLCLKTFSGHATMLEAPPGSREDLVEAARTPCTPTDLDTMLYGYTNGIYVLDHTPDAMPDMDMLKLFASPAGRALLAEEKRPRGSTSTSSLSREFSTRLKSSRRPSGTGTVSAPTSPPRQRKSSDELYKEAVEILGLTCTLTDSCPCIDCQSSYFDFGDDDCGDNRTELAAGTPILLDHALSNPLACSIQ